MLNSVLESVVFVQIFFKYFWNTKEFKYKGKFDILYFFLFMLMISKEFINSGGLTIDFQGNIILLKYAVDIVLFSETVSGLFGMLNKH